MVARNCSEESLDSLIKHAGGYGGHYVRVLRTDEVERTGKRVAHVPNSISLFVYRWRRQIEIVVPRDTVRLIEAPSPLSTLNYVLQSPSNRRFFNFSSFLAHMASQSLASILEDMEIDDIVGPPVYSLDSDVLAAVFTFNADIFADDEDALKITRLSSQVCRYWRRIILNSP